MSSRTLTSVVTPDTIALNAAIFGYAGHSIVTPHNAIQQVWWTDERIDAKVTREFIVSKLRLDERQQLDTPVAFGRDLTDARYIDWILSKAKRLYMILVEIGVPDQIFGIIDDAWDDEDLPIPLAQVSRLALAYRCDEKLNRKFHSTQFTFLLRPLTEGAHIEYASNEVIPIEYIHRLPPAAALQTWLRFHLPKKSTEVFVRRKISLGTNGEINAEKESQFLTDIDTSRLVQHKHIAPVYASWTFKGNGFFTTTFESEHTLKSFIDFRLAASLQKMTKPERNAVFINWLHCLAHALAALHDHGMCHSAITPSNIVIDGQNQIAFSDIGSLKSLQTDKKVDTLEIYNYSSPEKYATSPLTFLSSSPEEASTFRFGHRLKKSFDSRSSSSKSRQSSHSSGLSVASFDSSVPGLSYSKSPSIASETSLLGRPRTPEPARPMRPPPPVPKDSAIIPPPLDLFYSSSISLSTVSSSPPLSPKLRSQSSSPSYLNQQSDMFSLGCVFLDILTYMHRKKLGDFIKHRSTKHKKPVNMTPTNPSTAAAGATAVNGVQPSPSTTNVSIINSNSNPGNSRVDSSFHANTGKLASWMDTLESEAYAQQSDQAFRAIPHLLRLIRSMLNQNPLLRPSAAEVRDKVFDILTDHARTETLCCSGSATPSLAAYFLPPSLPKMMEQEARFAPDMGGPPVPPKGAGFMGWARHRRVETL